MNALFQKNYYKILLIILISVLTNNLVSGQNAELDNSVKAFLDKNKSNWDDLNVPYDDGKVLYDIIIKNNYTSALEIGTSTGHSTIWIAWALSKTGGTMTTIEINKSRQNEAMKNLQEVGLSHLVNFRLGDAHELVLEIKEPLDFIFSDADKGWYLQYFKDVDPKLKAGGCFTAHNVNNAYGGIKDFLNYVNSLDNYNTTIDKSSRSGVSISYKKAR